MADAWENSADAYARSFARLCAGTVDEILGHLGPRSGHHRLLDIGTGPGTVAAAASTSGSTVIGMDKDHSMTILAAQRHPEIAFARAALPRLPCADQTFDAITANFVLNHTPDPRAATRELLRALRIGGKLVATIWTSQLICSRRLSSGHGKTASAPGVRGRLLLFLGAFVDLGQRVWRRAVRLICAGWLPQDGLFGWNASAALEDGRHQVALAAHSCIADRSSRCHQDHQSEEDCAG